MTLAGKIALVAGATRGAGRGIATELGAAGATVYVTGRPDGHVDCRTGGAQFDGDTAARETHGPSDEGDLSCKRHHALPKG